jgi:hypothetical protein
MICSCDEWFITIGQESRRRCDRKDSRSIFRRRMLSAGQPIRPNRVVTVVTGGFENHREFAILATRADGIIT